MPAPGSLTVSETYSPPFAGGSAAQPADSLSSTVDVSIHDAGS